MNKKQCVVRTYPDDWNITTQNLDSKLSDGWTVVFITPVSHGIIEYILEKDISDDLR